MTSKSWHWQDNKAEHIKQLHTWGFEYSSLRKKNKQREAGRQEYCWRTGDRVRDVSHIVLDSPKSATNRCLMRNMSSISKSSSALCHVHHLYCFGIIWACGIQVVRHTPACCKAKELVLKNIHRWYYTTAWETQEHLWQGVLCVRCSKQSIPTVCRKCIKYHDSLLQKTPPPRRFYVACHHTLDVKTRVWEDSTVYIYTHSPSVWAHAVGYFSPSHTHCQYTHTHTPNTHKPPPDLFDLKQICQATQCVCVTSLGASPISHTRQARHAAPQFTLAHSAL